MNMLLFILFPPASGSNAGLEKALHSVIKRTELSEGPDRQSAAIVAISYGVFWEWWAWVTRDMAPGFRTDNLIFGCVITVTLHLFPLLHYNLKNLPGMNQRKKERKNVPNSKILVILPRSWHLVTIGNQQTVLDRPKSAARERKTSQ